MLFDLRGSGRRRTVKIVYITLAFLMGGGLVLFGIGGDVSGGLLNAFENDSGNQDVDETLQKRVDEFQAKVDANPKDADAWAELARAHFQAAGLGGDLNEDELVAAETSWDRHLELAEDNPDSDVATIMVQAFLAHRALATEAGDTGLADQKLDKAISALRIVSEARPDARLYAQLASYLYEAGQTREADLAGKEAVELAETNAERKQIKQALEQAKAQFALQAAQNSTSLPTITAPASTSSTTETGSQTTTTG
jgi:tetratricopeptide (TPR) repeat protein